MNYLQLVQALVTELGIGGANSGGTLPTTVDGQTGQLWNAVNWIKNAENNLNLFRKDWRYLATEYSETLTVGSTAVPTHSGSESVKKWDRQAFWLNRTLATAAQLEWQDWEEFRADQLPGSSTRSNAPPTIITQQRDDTLLLDNPSDATYALTGEFWKRPILLASDGSEPAMPEEFHRIIVCEAAIKYGNKEAAAEVIQGMEAEYAYLLAMLRADQLPGEEHEAMSAQDLPLEQAIPGFYDG